MHSFDIKKELCANVHIVNLGLAHIPSLVLRKSNFINYQKLYIYHLPLIKNTLYKIYLFILIYDNLTCRPIAHRCLLRHRQIRHFL